MVLLHSYQHLRQQVPEGAALYFTQDFSYQEIADAVGVPVGTVQSRPHRGRRLLQQALWVIAEEQGSVSALTNAPDDGD